MKEATFEQLEPRTLFSAMGFPTTGVWSEPRIYQDSSVHSGLLELDTNYTFKSKVENNTTSTQTIDLLGEIEPLSLEIYNKPVTLDAGKDSIRSATVQFQQPGIYDITYTIQDTGESISRQFEVVPEPITLATIVLGSIPILLTNRRKR